MLVQLPEYEIIKLTGPESLSFLQGQVTCDLNELNNKDWLPGAHCNAKGKAWSTFIAFRNDNDLLLILTKDSAQASLQELKKYSVFSKTDITLDTDSWHIYGADKPVAEIDGRQIELANNHYLIVANSSLPNADEDNAAWWMAEIMSGRANLYDGTIGEYVPQMINLQALNYISFSKGCYMGQEMVARMRYLGKNKRALYLAETQIDNDTTNINPADDVYRLLNGNSRSCGKVIDSASFEGRLVMQLILNNDTELSETLYLDAECNKPVQLLPLPYSLEQA